jgi:hypothetical protein
MTEQSHDLQNEATRCCNHARKLASFRNFTVPVTGARTSVRSVTIDGTKPEDVATTPFRESGPRGVSNEHIERWMRVLFDRVRGPGPDWNPAIRTSERGLQSAASSARTNPSDDLATTRVCWLRFATPPPELRGLCVLCGSIPESAAKPVSNPHKRHHPRFNSMARSNDPARPRNLANCETKPTPLATTRGASGAKPSHDRRLRSPAIASPTPRSAG